MITLRKTHLLQNSAAYGCIILCLVGDSTLGWWLWQGQSWWLWPLHLPLILLGTAGIALHLQLKQADEHIWPEKQVKHHAFARFARHLNGWSMTAFLFSLCMFPGLGPCAYGIAFIITTLLPKKMPAETFDATAPMATIGPPPNPEVQPLIDIVYDSDLDMRRAAVAELSRQAGPPAIHLLRQLLSDPQTEIRSDASIALNNLDDRLALALNDAFVEWCTAPKDRERTLFLANQYYQYASSNLLDDVSMRMYLDRARDLLLHITAQNATDVEVWFQLALIYQRQQAYPEALQAICTVLQLNPSYPEASFLALELAFRQHAWSTLVTLARNERRAQSLALTSLQWIGDLVEQTTMTRLRKISRQTQSHLSRRKEVYHG
ncbi:MAG TPA: HEAT repeat domain-containing protein [Ktedonobacteraceae bacterium]|jgi:tetratricopeptide (TPR) repeat protein|nr:HEAT repeat domain-containing protein [Ktedonobacteraceae bacterium]